MDTFNFSFFEDDPQAPRKDAPTEPVNSASSPGSDKPQEDADPFGFDEFDPQLNDDCSPASSLNEPVLDEDRSQVVDLDFDEPTRIESDEPSVGAPTGFFPDLSLDVTDYPLANPVVAPSDFEDDLVPDARSVPTPNIDSDEDALALDPISQSADVAEANRNLEFDSPDDAALPLETEATAEDTFEIDEIDDETPLQNEPPLPSPPLSDVSPPTVVPVPVAETTDARDRTAKPVRYLTVDDPYGEVAPPRERLRVAILGASGIGKSHARWFAKHSCDVVSFLGTSGESVDLTRSHLRAHMGFDGQGYTNLDQLIAQSQPQAVCIASPPGTHYEQTMKCLEAGIHVLCEKPLVYSKSSSRQENVSRARELNDFANKNFQVFAPQLQYGAATPILCRLAGVSPYEVGDFAMEVETTNVRAPRDPKALWIELAPHPLSVAQYLAGEGAEIVEETVQLLPSRSAYTSEVSARFGVRCEGGRLLMCRAIVRWFDKIVDNREPRRRFAFNGRVVQYSGVKSPDGTYIAQYVAPDGYISHYSDPVDYLVGNFVRTCWDEDALLMSGEQGVQNLDWLLRMSERV